MYTLVVGVMDLVANEMVVEVHIPVVGVGLDIPEVVVEVLAVVVRNTDRPLFLVFVLI